MYDIVLHILTYDINLKDKDILKIWKWKRNKIYKKSRHKCWERKLENYFLGFTFTSQFWVKLSSTKTKKEKKLTLLALLGATVLLAKNMVVSASELPNNAKEFISKHFKTAQNII